MAKVEVTMPQMGESITEGTIIVWHKQPGDAVELDETILEIGTDKVDTEVPSPAAGVLAEILVEEGETVDVGTPIAVLETEAEAAAGGDDETSPTEEASQDAGQEAAETADESGDGASAEALPEESTTPEAPEPAEASGDGGGAASGGGSLTDVVMPKMGESITEGTIIAWHKQPGDEIELDETILEIGTDKVDTEVPSPVAGVLAEILVDEGDTVEVGTVIARIATDAEAAAGAQPSGDGVSADEAPAGGRREPSRESAQEQQAGSGDGAAAQPVAEPAGPIPRKGDDGSFYSPLVRSIAEKEGLSLSELRSITGSGRDGRVTKEDVLSYIEQRQAQPAQPAARQAPAAKAAPQQAPRPAASPVASSAGDRVEIIDMDRMRQIIADHMVRSKATSAHVTSFAEVDVTNLVRLREGAKQAFMEREGIKLTYTPFFVYAAVQALREHPLLNASVEDKQIFVKKDYHIGIAVALGKTGLIAPVIRDAGQKNIVGLAHAAANMAERARGKQLQPDELQGGTFTVTNIGSLGSLMGTPIINQPQVGILATGAIKKRPVVVEHPDLGDTIAIRHMMYVSLSYDHRIIDGAMGASFLHAFAQVVEGFDPDATL